MNQDRPTQPKHISIDVEQWRSDISTFAETTSQALNAIVAELSGSCSSGFSGSSAAETPPPSYVNTENPVSPSPTSAATFDAGRDDRLEKLKSQLAQRISKSV